MTLTLETHPLKSVLLLREDTRERGNDRTALHGDAIKAHPQSRMGMILTAHLKYFNGFHFVVCLNVGVPPDSDVEALTLNVMIFGGSTLMTRFRRGHKGWGPRDEISAIMKRRGHRRPLTLYARTKEKAM